MPITTGKYLYCPAAPTVPAMKPWGEAAQGAYGVHGSPSGFEGLCPRLTLAVSHLEYPPATAPPYRHYQKHEELEHKVFVATNKLNPESTESSYGFRLPHGRGPLIVEESRLSCRTPSILCGLYLVHIQAPLGAATGRPSLLALMAVWETATHRGGCGRHPSPREVSPLHTQHEETLEYQLKMLHEATRWFPHTNFYDSMKANAQSEVDKKREHRDAVTGRLRIGGLFLSVLLFICVTQRQSNLEEIPLKALQMGGMKFLVWASLLSCICSLPIMITDVALGQSTQGSVITALNGLDKRLRGLGLAIAGCSALFAIAQTYVSSLVVHFFFTSVASLSKWLHNNDSLKRACVALSTAECIADSRCIMGAENVCHPALEAYISASWPNFLTSTDTTTKACNIICCLAIWLILTYALTQAPRTLGAVGACAFPCIFILLPALVVLEVSAEGQKHSLLDIFMLPNKTLPFEDVYYVVIMLPLLVYMPGDAAVLTVASYDKQSHNPIIISFLCFFAKWLVAYMSLYLLFFAEGLSPDPQAFREMFMPKSPDWITSGGPGSAVFPVMWYVIARMWPASWLLGLLSFAAILTQRISSCWCLTMVLWSALHEMRWLKASPVVVNRLKRQQSLSLPPLLPAAKAACSSSCREKQDHRHSEEQSGLRGLSSACPVITTDLFGQEKEQTGFQKTGACRSTRDRRSGCTDGRGSSSEAGTRRSSPLSRILKRTAGEKYDYEDEDRAFAALEPLFDAKPDAAADTLLSWWGGPDMDDHKKVGEEQVQRVGLLPLLVLGCGLIAVMLVPLFRIIFPIDYSDSLLLLLVLPVVFMSIAILIVTLQTAVNLRDILAEGKGPQRPKRGSQGSRRSWKGLHRSGARSLSHPRILPMLPRVVNSACNSREEHFLRSRSLRVERLSWRPRFIASTLPFKQKLYKQAHNTAERESMSDSRCVRHGNRRIRRAGSVLQLFLRLLKSNLYWTLIGNVEILRANLNMALSGCPTKPIPMIWGWLLKFVATPWLLLDFMEHLNGSLPKIIGSIEGPRGLTASVLLVWIVVVLGIILWGRKEAQSFSIVPIKQHQEAKQ
ncbi:hypothetical protein cyc_04172 [Cyclospora cayetanensis]|uniref:Uncharacterized protein n=1 Tax=Cyclospora cayetanensis TaxID=88456 RepID=A0A1D3D5B4_9EIME|nr:hypothetical protein cyc_04172 [Cyclospora cayetanensis]